MILSDPFNRSATLFSMLSVRWRGHRLAAAPVATHVALAPV